MNKNYWITGLIKLQMGWSPLMWSVYKNHFGCAEIFLKHGAHVNIIDDEDGLTPLIVACGRGYVELVELLLRHGAEVLFLFNFEIRIDNLFYFIQLIKFASQKLRYYP